MYGCGGLHLCGESEIRSLVTNVLRVSTHSQRKCLRPRLAPAEPDYAVLRALRLSNLSAFLPTFKTTRQNRVVLNVAERARFELAVQFPRLVLSRDVL